MTDRPPLYDYGASRAVLMGTWSYRHLPHLPAARHSLQRVTRLLTGELCGWPAARLTVLRNQDGTGHLADQLITQFEDVTDVALFYFVGHGQMTEADHGTELCLGLIGSRLEAHRRASTSLPFRAVRDALRHSPAARKIVILDCCYAGLATLPGNTLGPGIDVLDTVTITGAYTLAASAADSAAWYETDTPQPQTYFTKYLADIIEAGIPGEGEVLRLRTVFTEVRARLAEDGRPLPIERNVNSAHDLGFAYNTAPPTAATLADRSGSQVPAWRRRRIAVLAAAQALIVGVVLAVTLPGSGTPPAATAHDTSGFLWSLTDDLFQNGGLVGLWSTPDNPCSPIGQLCDPASVVVGTTFSGLTAYDPATGRQQWHWQPPDKDELCATSPTADGGDYGLIAAFDYGPHLTCRYLQTISLSTGKLNWAKAISLVGPGATDAPVDNAALSIVGDTVSAPYAGSADPSPGPDAPDNDILSAFVQDGTVNWTTNFGAKPMPLNWDTPPMSGGCHLSGTAAVVQGSYYTVGVCGGQDWVLSMDIGPTPMAPLPGCRPITSGFITGFLTTGPDGLVIGCNLDDPDLKLYILHDGATTVIPVDLSGVDTSIIYEDGNNGQQSSNMVLADNTMYLVGGLNQVDGGPNDSVVAVDMDTGKQEWTATLPGNSSVRLLAATDGGKSVTVVAHGMAAPAVYTVRAPGIVHRDYVLNPHAAAAFLNADRQPESTYAVAEGVNIAVGFYKATDSEVMFGVLPR